VGDLSGVSAGTFEPLVGEQFPTGAGGGDTTLVLESVTLGPEVAGYRRQFTLTFAGSRSSFLGQGTRRLRHARLGELDVFLVPVGTSETAYHYEAVFA
jgi:hypothetical protein